MLFKLILSNHRNLAVLEDYALLLRLLIESSGHQFHCDPVPVQGACHIFIECFTGRHVSLMQEIKQTGSEIIVVATEYITGNTFNDFSDTDSGHYSNRAYWQSRFNTFKACAQSARSIWCATDDPRQIQLYRAVVNIPVIPLPFPYFPTFPRVTHVDKNIDVFFSGSHTTYRQNILTQLQKYQVVYLKTFPTGLARQRFVAQSKVCLNLKQSLRWNYPSKMRYWYHLSNESFLLGEQCQIPCALDPFILTVPSKQLVDTCKELLRRGLPVTNYQQFAAECPAKPAVEELLDLSFKEKL